MRSATTSWVCRSAPWVPACTDFREPLTPISQPTPARQRHDAWLAIPDATCNRVHDFAAPCSAGMNVCAGAGDPAWRPTIQPLLHTQIRILPGRLLAREGRKLPRRTLLPQVAPGRCRVLGFREMHARASGGGHGRRHPAETTLAGHKHLSEPVLCSHPRWTEMRGRPRRPGIQFHDPRSQARHHMLSLTGTGGGRSCHGWVHAPASVRTPTAPVRPQRSCGAAPGRSRR